MTDTENDEFNCLDNINDENLWSLFDKYAEKQTNETNELDRDKNNIINNCISCNSTSLIVDTSTSNYRSHFLYGDGSSAGAGDYGTGASFLYLGNSTTTSSIFANIIIDILDYTSVNKNKTIRHFFGEDMNGSGKAEFFSGSWLNSSTAINAINFTINGGSTTIVQYSQFALYGIK